MPGYGMGESQSAGAKLCFAQRWQCSPGTSLSLRNRCTASTKRRPKTVSRRIPNDWPTVALGLAMGIGIWTSDRGLFGCGVPVWTTQTLLTHLELAAHAWTPDSATDRTHQRLRESGGAGSGLGVEDGLVLGAAWGTGAAGVSTVSAWPTSAVSRSQRLYGAWTASMS